MKKSHPTWVRGLKCLLRPVLQISARSHPTWVRGLKCLVLNGAGHAIQSHPTWVRGLKYFLALTIVGNYEVAPHVGAWIEIDCWRLSKLRLIVAPHVGAWIEIPPASSAPSRWPSHPTWVRGLKFNVIHPTQLGHLSHPTWVRGLK